MGLMWEVLNYAKRWGFFDRLKIDWLVLTREDIRKPVKWIVLISAESNERALNKVNCEYVKETIIKRDVVINQTKFSDACGHGIANN